jgi:thiamine biosynthesis protein ThiI
MKETIQHKPIVMIRFSEIAIKSSKTRRWLTQRLVDHIKYVLNLKNIQNFEVINDYSRLFVVSNDSEKISEYIATLIPGTASLSIVYKVNTNLDEIGKIIDVYFKNNIRTSTSFAVRVRRTGDHAFTSVELAAKIGEYIIDSNSDIQLKVNLTNPDYTLHLDVRGTTTYVFDNSKAGLGGLPVGCQGNVLVLVKGEEEDIANIIQLYKRGANTIIYSIETKQNITEEFLESIGKILVLQPKTRKLHQNMFFIENELDIQEILELYKKYNCKGISISKSLFSEFSSLLPISIPLFVPHLASEVDRKDLEIFD